jgi:exopolyphosphatase/guanosine-5'-triphosphate,3'-diphosphate pyrophosphatase
MSTRRAFSQSQQRRIGELVLGQRGGLRKVDRAGQETFAWQVLCLRLAVIKCHARSEVSTSALTLQGSGREAHLGFSARWAELHPRTTFLLAEEAEFWARSGTLRLLMPA